MAYCDSCCGNSDILLFTVGFFIFYAIGPKIKILKTTSSFEISPVGILKVSNFLPIIKVFIYIFYSENAPKTN